MTNPDDMLKALLPSKALFYHGAIPEPLGEETREWLVEQLHAYPKRVNEARTCAIGALTDMATTEFCRLMAERRIQPADDAVERLRDDWVEVLRGGPISGVTITADVAAQMADDIQAAVAALAPQGEKVS